MMRESRAQHRYNSLFQSLFAQKFEVIRVYYEAGNVVETHEHAGDFKEPSAT